MMMDIEPLLDFDVSDSDSESDFKLDSRVVIPRKPQTVGINKTTTPLLQSSPLSSSQSQPIPSSSKSSHRNSGPFLVPIEEPTNWRSPQSSKWKDYKSFNIRDVVATMTSLGNETELLSQPFCRDAYYVITRIFLVLNSASKLAIPVTGQWYRCLRIMTRRHPLEIARIVTKISEEADVVRCVRQYQFVAY